MEKIVSITLVCSIMLLIGCKDKHIPEVTPTPTPTSPLAKMIGNVAFVYAFSDDGTVFRQKATFSKVILNSSGNAKIVKDSKRDISCVVSAGDFEFLCLKVFSDNAMTLFYFNKESSVSLLGEGVFEFCTSDVVQIQCVRNILNSPDGAVAVSVSRGSSSKPRSKSRAIDYIENEEDMSIYSEGLDMDRYAVETNVETDEAELKVLHENIRELIEISNKSE